MTVQRTTKMNASRKAALLRVSAAIALALAVTTSALAHERSRIAAAHTASSAAAHVHHLLQVGKASWYGLNFQGRRTATGERFNSNGLTCAHRSLPLGSWIRVTNLRNSKSVFVRVNDRGPFGGNSIVDLSYAAAQAVDLRGTGQVQLEAVSSATPEMARELVAQNAEIANTPANTPNRPLALATR